MILTPRRGEFLQHEQDVEQIGKTNTLRDEIRKRHEAISSAKLMPTPPPVKSTALEAKLNRYTSLPIALDMLRRKSITLLSPESWEDQNDAYYLERYRADMKLRSVLAVCFSMSSETFHHWRIFSHGGAGVCIEFSRLKLLKAFDGLPGFRMKEVSYEWIGDLQKNRPDIENWPFLKRMPFKAESEYRILYETKKEALKSRSVNFDLTAIRMITLSPWLPESVSESIIQIIRAMDGCGQITVNRSSLLDNAGWRKIVE